MKIGVITFCNSKDNYGQMLQIYALQCFLRKMGHECFLIRYNDSPKAIASFKWSKIMTYLCKFPQYVIWYIQQKKENCRQKAYATSAQSSNAARRFDDFLNDNVEMTPLIYDEKSIIDNPPQADTYVCGSDQIWCGDWAYYLNFAPEDAIKIAYAPSMGGITNFSPEYEAEMKRLIHRLDFVGMREQSGVEVCKRLGRADAVKVVDPTLLLGTEDYDKIKVPVKVQKPYLFLYLLGNPIGYKTKYFYDYATTKGLDVVYVASQGRIDEYDKFPAQVGEWLYLLSNAEMVITNSFHCTVFSLIYHRRVVTVPLVGGYERMNTRINELLENTELERLILNDDINRYQPEDWDFSRFDIYKDAELKRSADYFKGVLVTKSL